MKQSTKLLLLEDNSVEARIIEEYIKDLDHQAIHLTVVSSLKDALQELQEKNFDLIISDLTLPDSFGVDTFITLKSKYSNLPVIIMTNLEDEKVSASLKGAGAKDYIFKSESNPQSFEKAVNRALLRADTAKKIKEESSIKSKLEQFPEVKEELKEIYLKLLLLTEDEKNLEQKITKYLEPQVDGIIMLQINNNDIKNIHNECLSQIKRIDLELAEKCLKKTSQFINSIYF